MCHAPPQNRSTGHVETRAEVDPAGGGGQMRPCHPGITHTRSRGQLVCCAVIQHQPQSWSPLPTAGSSDFTEPDEAGKGGHFVSATLLLQPLHTSGWGPALWIAKGEETQKLSSETDRDGSCNNSRAETERFSGPDCPKEIKF